MLKDRSTPTCVGMAGVEMVRSDPHGVILRYLSVFVVVALITLGWSPAATADDGAAAPSDAIAQALEMANAPDPVFDDDVEIPESADDDAAMETDVGRVTMGIPAVGEAEVDGPTAIYEGTVEDITVALQPAAGGLRALVHIDSAEAPERFDFVMGGDVATLEMMPDGSVVALNPDDEVLAVAPTPWALDANGVNVPTYYEISGTTLTQVVEHKAGDFVYGIVADPWWNPFSWPWGKWVKASGKAIKKAAGKCVKGAVGAALVGAVGTKTNNILIKKFGGKKALIKITGWQGYVGLAAAGCVANNIPR